MIGAAALLAAAVAPAASFYAAPFYVVVFKISGKGVGQPETLSVARVLDPTRTGDRPVPVEVPSAFIDAVRNKRDPAEAVDGAAFFYAYLDPTNPANASFDPRKLSAPLVELTPGRSVTVAHGATGWTVRRAQTAAAVPISYPTALAMREAETGFSQPGKRLPKRTAGDPPAKVKPPAGTVRFTMRAGADGHSFLIVENGTKQLFTYRAMMTRPGTPATMTSVCAAPPDIGVSEHWEYLLERLSLADFALLPPDVAVPCR